MPQGPLSRAFSPLFPPFFLQPHLHQLPPLFYGEEGNTKAQVPSDSIPCSPRGSTGDKRLTLVGGGGMLVPMSQGHSLSWDLAPTTQSHGRTLSPVKEAREKMNMSPPSSASKNATVPPA